MADIEAAEARPPRRSLAFILTISTLFILTVVFSLLAADTQPPRLVKTEAEVKPSIEFDPAPEALADLPEAVAKGAAQTVMVNFQGTGVVLRSGIVLTAAHVVDYAEGRSAVVDCGNDGPDDTAIRAPILRVGRIIISPILHDVAIIEVDECKGETLALADRRPPADESLRIAGFDFAVKNGTGYINRFVRGSSFIKDGHMTTLVSPLSTNIIHLEDELRRHFRIPRPRALSPIVNPGNSGSPVFSMDGKILGIAVVAQGSHGRTFMVPVKTIRLVLKAAGISEGEE